MRLPLLAFTILVIFINSVEQRGNESLEGNDVRYSLLKTDESEKEVRQIIAKSCGDPWYVEHAHRVGSVFNFPNKISFQCNDGYTMRGNGTRYCETNGTWSGNLPTCEPIFCDPPESPENGKVSYSSLGYESELHYECNSGFILKNDQGRICSANGTWSGNEPTCLDQLNCTKFDDEDFFIFYDKEQAVNSSAMFFCKDMDKKIDESNVVTCLPNGNWSDDPPKCKSSPIVKCPKFNDMELFILYDNGQAVNSTAVFFCKEKRKKLHGKNLVTCLPNGQWSADPPECKMTCSIIEETEGMRVFHSENLDEGSIAAFLCSYPRIRFGVVWTTCKANGEWTDPPPNCIYQLNCTKFDDEDFFIFYDKEQAVNSSAMFFCKDMDKKIDESNVVTCLPNGNWSDDPPKCKSSPIVKCPKFNDMELFILYDNGQAVNSTAVFFCKEKRKKLHGKNLVTCLPNGQWSADPPECKMTCSIIEETEGMRVFHSENLDEGSIAAFLCSYPRIRFGVVWTTCKANGEWTDPPPNCILPCSVDELSFPGLTKGRKKFYLPNHVFSVTCERGFNVTKENNQLKCVNGAWQGHLPPCIEANCNVDDLVESEVIVPDGEKIVWSGEYLKVKCREGYSPSGKEARCSRGQWTVTGKLCRESSCTVHRIINGGFSERVEKKQLTWSLTYDRWYEYPRLSLYGTRSPGSWIYVSCDDRYSFQGKRGGNHVSVKCSKGKWDPEPACLITGTNYRYEAREESGRTNTHANRSPTTTRRPFNKAKVLNCPLDQLYDVVPANVVPVMEETASNILPYNSTLRLTCENNMMLIGSDVAKCGQEGKWLVSRVQCTPTLKCSKFDDRNLIIQYDKDQVVNSTAVFFCKDNQEKLDGPNVVTCLTNGKWSGGPPTCKSPPIVKCPEFDDMELFILYDSGQAVNSIAVFFCKDKRKNLHGTNLVTCLPNGQWSGNPPKCKMTCPWIEEIEGMRVFYTKNLDEGSIAAFLCSYPRIRFGVVWTTCKANGEWTDPPPKCISSSCSLEKLFDVIPENVVPVVEGVTSDTLPINTSLHLICKNNTTLNGLDTAHCGENGTWEVSEVQCISGCNLPRTENSELIIEPDKSYYRDGESAALSCSPGYVLNSKVVRLMCVGTSWSENVPECQKE